MVAMEDMDTDIDNSMLNSFLSKNIMNNLVEKFSTKNLTNICVMGLLFFTTTSLKSQESPSLEGNKSAGGAGIKLVPRVSLSETWSSNLSLKSGAGDSGWITELSPGIRADSSAGRIKGYLDYSLHQFSYSNSLSGSLQNALASAVTIEALDNWAYVDVSGLVTQRTISAFGAQSSINGINDSNKTEFSSFSVSPYLLGRLFKKIDYEARYGYSSTRAKGFSGAKSDQATLSFRLSGDEFFEKLRWSVDGSQQKNTRNSDQTVQSDNLKGTLTYSINRQFSLSATSGREANNFTSSQKEAYTTSGAGINWQPAKTTKFSANFENKLLGRMHQLSIEHRTPRTVWAYSDVKSVSLANSADLNTSPGSLYALLYEQFASSEPDPTKRAQLVRNFMQSNGLSSTATLNGYLTSGTSVRRVQDLSLVLLGIRDTVTFTVSRSVGKRVSDIFGNLDDFSNSAFIHQDGLSAGYSHRLTPEASLNAKFAFQKITGEFSAQDSRIKSINISVSSKVSEKTFVTLGARRVISSGGISPYNETGLIGSLTAQF